jgi:uncharacterized membrane protein YraQ (UPF0718 family)/copper chaperone CopZ
MSEFLIQTWNILLELAPWLLLGSLVAGAMHVLLPHDFVKRHLTGTGGILKAVALGVPLPLCSCGVIPAGLGIKKDGASDGASVGFLISTPQTGVDSILVSAAFLGWPFALFKVAAATVTGIAGGWLTERFGGPRKSLDSETSEEGAHTQQGWRGAVEHAEDIIRSIWGWLLFGILVSAAINFWIPPDAFGTVTTWGGIITMFVVLGISLPMYICATASVPIAAALVAGGMPTGAALVFLMAGPATNVATIGAIHKGFGLRILSIYLLTIIVGSIGLGIAFDELIDTTAQMEAMTMSHDAWWATGSAVLLTALILRYAASDLKRYISQKRMATADLSNHVVVNVEGMTCGGCVSRLEGALNETEGVTSAVVTLKPGQAIVQGSVDEAGVTAVVHGAGFKVVGG